MEKEIMEDVLIASLESSLENNEVEVPKERSNFEGFIFAIGCASLFVIAGILVYHSQFFSFFLALLVLACFVIADAQRTLLRKMSILNAKTLNAYSDSLLTQVKDFKETNILIRKFKKELETLKKQSVSKTLRKKK